MKKTAMTLMSTLLCVSAGWHGLKSVDAYRAKDFHFKSGVAYVEMRLQNSIAPMHDPKHLKVKTKRVFAMGRKSPSSFGSKIANKFRHLPMSAKKRHTLLSGRHTGLIGTSTWYYNGFMLDTQGKMWRLEGIKDLIDMVAPIDTPAEVSLVLWANKHNEWSAKYRKSGDHYLVEDHVVADTSAGCFRTTYRSTITRSGRMTHRKRISKHPSQECGAE